VNDKFQVAVAYSRGKDPPLTITQEAVWTPEQEWILEKRKISFSAKKLTKILTP
jgi:hypothetical protein